VDKALPDVKHAATPVAFAVENVRALNPLCHRCFSSRRIIPTPKVIAASARKNERLRASQRGDAFAMVFPTLTARNPLPTNVLYKKNIPMPQNMIPKIQSDSKLPALWEFTGASFGSTFSFTRREKLVQVRLTPHFRPRPPFREGFAPSCLEAPVAPQLFVRL